MTLDSILAGGGVGGVVVAVAFAVKQIVDGIRAKQAGEVTETSAAVNDASTANAIILKGMKAVGEENAGLRTENAELKAEIKYRDVKILELEKVVAATQAKLAEIASELQQLKSHG